jgi:hypothetical protein
VSDPTPFSRGLLSFGQSLKIIRSPVGEILLDTSTIVFSTVTVRRHHQPVVFRDRGDESPRIPPASTSWFARR